MPPTEKTAGPVLVVSTDKDAAEWKKLAKLEVVSAVLSVDHMLTCLLRQTLDCASGRLDA